MAWMAVDTSARALGPEEPPKSTISIVPGNEVLLLHKWMIAASIRGFILFC
jgi:hypothetical protein